MTLKDLAEEIRRLAPRQRHRLLRMVGGVSEKDNWRGGPSDPLSKLIGTVNTIATGSERYKEDLYGGEYPL